MRDEIRVSKGGRRKRIKISKAKGCMKGDWKRRRGYE